MNARELLAAVRAAKGYPSNYRLARELGIEDRSVQRWNSGANTPDDVTAARLAELAGLDPDAVVAAMHAERAATDPERALWQRIADRLERGAVAAAVVLSLGFFSGGPDGGALAYSADNSAQSAAGRLYIMSTARRILRRLRDLFTPASQGLTILPA